MEPIKISCRVTVKKLVGSKVYKLAQYPTYGIMLDNRTIKTAEGHKFYASRKGGFGKTGTWELERDYSGLAGIKGYTTDYIRVCIDRIEQYTEE